VEKINHVTRDSSFATKAGQKFGLRLLDGGIDTGPGRQLLRQQLTELA
jgi:hypothetical protein